MSKDNLKQKAASGMAWTTLQHYSTIFIQFVSGIILARLLTPFDYGCIGMLSIFMVLAETFINGGFGSALIQKKCPTQIDYSTVFFWNMGMSALMYVLLFFVAPYIANFYEIPLLSSVLRVQGLVLFVNAFNLVQRIQLTKKIDFKAIAIVIVATLILSFSVTIVMAYRGYGVWALVVQNLISAIIPTIVFWFYVKWRPSWVFCWQSFKDLFGFGFYMFLTNIISQLSQKIQGLLIGKFYNPTIMGYYSKAASTESLASQGISKVMTQVTYPLYVEVQNDKVALSNMIKRLTMTVSYITFPILFILMLCAKPIFVLLYSDRWMQSIPYFQALCFAGMAGCLLSVNFQAIAAIGKSKTLFFWTLLKRIVGIGAVVLGLMCFGMKGLLTGVIVNSWFSYIVNISLVSKYVGYKSGRQILDLLPVVVVSVIAACGSYVVGYFLNLNMYLDGVVKFIVFLVVYLGWSFLFKPEAYTYTLTVIPSKLKFWERKSNKQKNSN